MVFEGGSTGVALIAVGAEVWRDGVSLGMLFGKVGAEFHHIVHALLAYLAPHYDGERFVLVDQRPQLETRKINISGT